MAPRRKKKSSFARQFAIVAVILVLLQGIFIFMFQPSEQPLTAAEATKKAIDKSLIGKEDATKAMAQLHGAIMDFRIKSGGKLPNSLRDLVPEYFPAIPNDPNTGQPFEYVVQGGKYTLGQPSNKQAVQVVAAGGTGSIDEGQALIDLLNASAAKDEYTYDPKGKRDPFIPFEFAPRRAVTGNTPLERWPISQLKLTAVVAGIEEPVAIIENPEGKGLRAKKGMKIGVNGGEIVEVLADKVLIIESETDFTGERKTRTFEMKLREMGAKETSP